MLEIFMILITEEPDGGLSGAFAIQQGRESCEARLPAITSIIANGGTVIHEAVCVEGDWQFSEFRHSYEEENVTSELHTYLVTFDDGPSPTVTISPKTSMSMCESAKADSRTYCVTSRQRLISQNDH